MRKPWANLTVVLLFVALQAKAAETAPGGAPSSIAAPYHEFARGLEEAVAAGDADQVKQFFNLDLVLDKAMKGLPAPAPAANSFREGVRKGQNLGNEILAAVKTTGSYKLLRLRRVEGKPRALFRMLAGDAGVNYHDLALAEGPEGTIKLADCYIYALGDWLSETFRRSWMQVAAEANKGLLSKLVSRESEYLQAVPQIQAMYKLGQAGKFREALAAYLALPPSVQKDKTLMVVQVHFSSSVDEKALAESVERFQKVYPLDPALDLLELDHLTNRQEYDLALQSLARLQKTVGGDPYLLFLQGIFMSLKKEPAAAKKLYEQAIAEEPDLAAPYWGLVTLSLDQQQYAETVRLLNRIETALDLEITDLTAIPEYAGFVQSKEYRAWMKKRKVAADTAP